MAQVLTLRAQFPFCLLGQGEEKEVLPEYRIKPLEVTAAQTFSLFNLVFSCQTGGFFLFLFFMCAHLFIDKPMVITEPAVAEAGRFDTNSSSENAQKFCSL